MHDVARMAKVSARTVSRVINHPASVHPTTRARVEEVIRKLSFVPNLAARRLASGRNNLLAVFSYEPHFPTERTDFFYPFLEGIQEAAGAAGYNILLFTGNQKNDSVFIERGINRAGIADGLITMGTKTNRGDLCKLVAMKFPVVNIGRREIDAPLDWVTADYRQGFAEAVIELARLGHRRIAFLSESSHGEPAEDQLSGYYEGLRRVQIEQEPEFVFQSIDEASARLPRLLEKPESAPTALIVGASPDIEPMVNILLGMGVNIPRDLSLVGADRRVEAYSEDFLTMVKMPKIDMGRRAVQILLDRIQNPAGSSIHEYLPCSMFYGRSIAPPRKPR
ncbi:MAG: LacI family DNA-binding transcriptional regulator [Bacillota bacterium]